MKVAISLLAMLLTGCAYDVAKTAHITGNEVGITVNNVWNANEALPIADKHCHQYGKAARLSVSGEYSFSYDCVPIQ